MANRSAKERWRNTLSVIAEDLNVSYECARKWWQRRKKTGLAGLMLRKRAR